MPTQRFPTLDPQIIAPTKAALHAYAGVLGGWLKACRPVRKHWWHASLRPSLNGLTTSVVHAGIDFELELNLRLSLLQGRTSGGESMIEPLRGQSPAELAGAIKVFLVAAGIGHGRIPDPVSVTDGFDGYSATQAKNLGITLNSVAAAMGDFRAGIREESSPIQLWPHHFDLSMIWLPGDKIAGQDLENEEYSDMQMNFGFTFGDEGIAEPYFYVTAYPLPDALPALALPDGTEWRSEGFSGAVLLYRSLIHKADPDIYLSQMWNDLLSAGREHMTSSPNRGNS
jgi:hypothetical protein